MIVTNSPAQQIDTIAWQYIAGADPGFFLGGGGGTHPLHPPPRSAPALSKHRNQLLSDYMYHEKKDKSAPFMDDLENVYNSLHTCCLNIS